MKTVDRNFLNPNGAHPLGAGSAGSMRDRKLREAGLDPNDLNVKAMLAAGISLAGIKNALDQKAEAEANGGAQRAQTRGGLTRSHSDVCPHCGRSDAGVRRAAGSDPAADAVDHGIAEGRIARAHREKWLKAARLNLESTKTLIGRMHPRAFRAA